MTMIVVASLNPVKIVAAKSGFQHMFRHNAITARGVAVASGVADQPMSDDETRRGALNRVAAARDLLPQADYWVGIEGGVEWHAGQLTAFAWVVITNGTQTGTSRTATFCLPEEVAQLVSGGLELGQADDLVFGRSNSKQQNGSVGLLTDDALDRTLYYEQSVILALIPFKNPQFTFKP
jgi:inosine/xanthosine triphosphatase